MSTGTHRIGFIGLGAMGAGMAERVHASGMPLIVYDISEERCAAFGSRGIAVAASTREVAQAAEIVISSLPSVDVSRAVSCGPGGVIEGRSVKIYVETGTIGAVAMAEIADKLAQAGIAAIDGPVSGGQAGAGKGTLSTILAGPPDATERFRSVANTYANHVFVVGDRPGRAQTAKLVNNMLSLTGMIAAFEGMVMGAKAGLDPQTLLDIINVSTGRNSATLEKIPERVLPRTFGGHVATGVKDLDLYVSECQMLGVPTWMARRALEVFHEAIEHGIGGEMLRVIQYMEALAGGVEVKARPLGGPAADSPRSMLG